MTEDAVWDECLRDVVGLATVPDDPRSLVHYVLTEMVNNAIDHSGSSTFDVRLVFADGRIVFEVVDRGVGVFARILAGTSAEGPFEAAQMLTLGKLTTWPERHTGEGIFFSSRAAQLFRIDANGVRLSMDNERDDWALGESSRIEGSLVHVEVDPDSAPSLVDVFRRYTDENFEFDATSTVVSLFEAGVRFISRSEAKRLAAGLEQFRRVRLDFRGVDEVGQGFVDELFRVWAASHPEIALEYVNASDAVRFMIERGLPRP